MRDYEWKSGKTDDTAVRSLTVPGATVAAKIDFPQVIVTFETAREPGSKGPAKRVVASEKEERLTREQAYGLAKIKLGNMRYGIDASAFLALADDPAVMRVVRNVVAKSASIAALLSAGEKVASGPVIGLPDDDVV